MIGPSGEMKHRIVQALRDASGQPWALMLERRPPLTSVIADIELGRDIPQERLFAAMAGRSDVRTIAPGGAVQIIPAGRGGKAKAIVSVKGLALYDLEFQPFAFSTRLLAQTMAQLAGDREIGSIVLDMNTPGGVVTGTPEAADAVFAARQKKRVTALVNPLTASAGYWIAGSASEIIAVPSAEVGSIGVFMLHLDFSGALKAEGVTPTFIFSGKFKTEGNSLEPLSAAGRERFQSDVDKIGANFIKAVARGRGRTVADVRANFGQGRVFFAPEAKSVGMIDRMGTFDQALAQALEAPRDGAAARMAPSRPSLAKHNPRHRRLAILRRS